MIADTFTLRRTRILSFVAVEAESGADMRIVSSRFVYRRSCLIAALVVLLSTTMIVLTPGVASASTAGPYYIKFTSSGKCFHVPGTANSTQMDQSTCANQTNEHFYLDYVNSTNFRIRSQSSKKCLNFQGASTKKGTRVIIYTCGSHTDETFINFDVVPAGYGEIFGIKTYGSINLPEEWNGYGYVPAFSNGAKLIEGSNAIDYNAYASVLWCKSLSSCKETP